MGSKSNGKLSEKSRNSLSNDIDGGIQGIFNIVQKHPNRTKYFAKQLFDLYKSDTEKFHAQFFPCINKLLFTPQKDYIKMILEFIVSFLLMFDRGDDDDLHPFQEQFMMYILKDEIMYSKIQSVRLRACQLIRKILSQLPADISLTEDLCEAIIKPLVTLLKDTKSSIRAEAIASLYRLQDPTDASDIVTKLYTYHLCNDPDAKVRRCCIQHLARSYHLLPYVFERISDVDERVRKDSFLYLSRFNFKTFKIQQRLILLEYGLQEDSKLVQHCVQEDVIPKWIEKFENTIFEFLEMLCLDVDQDKLDYSIGISKMLLKFLFGRRTNDECIQMLPLNDARLIKLEDLTHAKMLCWSCLVEHFHENSSVENNVLDDFLPGVTALCKYIDEYLIAENLQVKQNDLINQSILLQLFDMLRFCDFSEIAGFDFTKELIVRLLTTQKFSPEPIELLMEILTKMFPDINERSSLAASIVSDLIGGESDNQVEEVSSRVGFNKDVKVAELMFQMFSLREQEEDAVQKADYLRAAEIKAKINDLNKVIEQEKTAVPAVAESPTSNILTGEDAECQILQIYAALLHTSKMKSIPANIQTFVEEVCLPTLREIKKDLNIQKAGLTCLVRFALQNGNYAMIAIRTVLLKLAAVKHIPDLFDIDLIKICLASIGDLITIYGSTHFNETEMETTNKEKRTLYQDEIEIFNEDDQPEDTSAINENISSKMLIAKLVSYLDDVDGTIRTIAGDTLCRLMVRGVLQSPTIVSRLNIYIFNPATAKDEKLRQIISTSLSYCATLNDFQKTFEEAFFLTMKTYFEAPPSSPLTKIESKTLLSHLIYHTSPMLKPGNHYNPHNNIAIKMCEKMLAEPDGLAAFYYSKEILTLSISTDDAYLVETLSKLAKNIIDKTSSKTTNSGMQKFLDILSQYPVTAHNTVLTERNTVADENDVLNTSKIYRKAFVVLDRFIENNSQESSESITSSPTIFKNTVIHAKNIVLSGTSSSSSSESEDEDMDSEHLFQPIGKRKKFN